MQLKQKRQFLRSFGELERSGEFRELVMLLEKMPREIYSDPDIALSCARWQVKRGDFKSAAYFLTGCDIANAPESTQVIWRLEKTIVDINHGAVSIEAGCQTAVLLIDRLPGMTPVSDFLRASSLTAQILLVGAAFFVDPAENRRRARDILTSALAKSKSQERLALRFVYTDSLTDSGDVIHELEDLAMEARKLGRPDLGGHAKSQAAKVMLNSGGSSEKIRRILREAGEMYDEAGHRFGKIDIQRILTDLKIERELAGPDLLSDVLELYRAASYPKAELSVLMDLIQLLHENGDVRASLIYHEELIALAERTGFHIYKFTVNLRMVDFMTRTGDYRKAIELATSSLASPNLPPYLRASYEQLLGTVYSFVKDHDSSDTHFSIARGIFEKLGMSVSVLNVIAVQVNHMDARREDAAWQAAEDLLAESIEKAGNYPDREMTGRFYEELAQIKLNQFAFSPTRANDPQLVAEAEQILLEAERNLAGLPEKSRMQRKAALHQIRGRIADSLNDPAGSLKEWGLAAEAFDSAGFKMEAANSRYMIGVIFHNLANQNILPNALIGQEMLLRALSYYRESGMKMEEGNTNYMLASLSRNVLNMISHLPDHVSSPLTARIFTYIDEAGESFDTLRREYYTGDSVETREGKRSIIDRSARLYRLATEMHLWKSEDTGEAWKWVQRAKARGLADTLAGNIARSENLLNEIKKKSPDGIAMIERERELIARVKSAPADQVGPLHKELDNLRLEMASESALEQYIGLNMGSAVSPHELEAIAGDEADSGRSCVFIDWAAIGRKLYLVCFRPKHEPEFVPLDIGLDEVETFVRSNLSDAAFRSTLRDNAELLDELNALIAPIDRLTQPEELLVMSPTGRLFMVPIHALQLSGQPLLVRNPVIYEPSLSVLKYCYAKRGPAAGSGGMIIFGDPNKNLPAASRTAEYLLENFAAEVVTGANVTKAMLTEETKAKDIIHFQGHARFDNSDSLNSYLSLADGKMYVRDIFSGLSVDAQLFSLTACESGRSEVEEGDEPFGLVPALLYAGSRTVMATLWRVHQESAAELTVNFYNALYRSKGPVDKARSLRTAVLALREKEEFSAPYHWAGYVLYGDWR
jgi:CHAT domain-containing protein